MTSPSNPVLGEGEDLIFDNDATLPYKHIKNLGYGHSAIVEMVEDVTTGAVFAHKSFSIVGSFKQRKHLFENEIKIIRRLAPHHHIIRVFATYVSKRVVGLLLQPVADHGDLASFLDDYKEARDDQKVQVEHTRILDSCYGCLASGLAFMHRQRIRHKDIKPQNILVHNGSMIYTDFGYSLDHSEIIRSTTTGVPSASTRKYCAPEVSDYGSRNSKSDIWSLGCVFLEINFALHDRLTPPNPGTPYHQYAENSQFRSQLWGLGHLGRIIFGMLSTEQEIRPSAESLVSRLRMDDVDRFCIKCKDLATSSPSSISSASYRHDASYPAGYLNEHNGHDPQLPQVPISYVYDSATAQQETTSGNPWTGFNQVPKLIIDFDDPNAYTYFPVPPALAQISTNQASSSNTAYREDDIISLGYAQSGQFSLMYMYNNRGNRLSRRMRGSEFCAFVPSGKSHQEKTPMPP